MSNKAPHSIDVWRSGLMGSHIHKLIGGSGQMRGPANSAWGVTAVGIHLIAFCWFPEI